uniref:Uncharacterized protein n=1 Tax=Sphaerodactylus townsendi TaxID=933632 RepID=A0ACB8FJD3_9SAUR
MRKRETKTATALFWHPARLPPGPSERHAGGSLPAAASREARLYACLADSALAGQAAGQDRATAPSTDWRMRGRDGVHGRPTAALLNSDDAGRARRRAAGMDGVLHQDEIQPIMQMQTSKDENFLNSLSRNSLEIQHLFKIYTDF